MNQHGEAKVVRCNGWQGYRCIPDMVGACHISDDFRTDYYMRLLLLGWTLDPLLKVFRMRCTRVSPQEKKPHSSLRKNMPKATLELSIPMHFLVFVRERVVHLARVLFPVIALLQHQEPIFRRTQVLVATPTRRISVEGIL